MDAEEFLKRYQDGERNFYVDLKRVNLFDAN